MKNSKLYIIFPILLICISISNLYIYFSSTEEVIKAGTYEVYYSYTSLLSSLFFLILNGIIAYVVYYYKEGKALIIIHIGYIFLILNSLNTSYNPEPSTGAALEFLFQIALDISAVVYATKLQNQELARWLKTFTIAVLGQTMLSIVFSVFLDRNTTVVLDTILSVAVDSILILFFWNLEWIKIAGDEDDLGPGDLLSKKDLL